MTWIYVCSGVSIFSNLAMVIGRDSQGKLMGNGLL